MSVQAIESVLSQMRAAVAAAEGKTSPAATAASSDFSTYLKASLDQVAHTQNIAESLEQRFTLNDPQVSLSETMIAMQKANISLQAAVQVRNKVVAAYNDIMNMQV